MISYMQRKNVQVHLEKYLKFNEVTCSILITFPNSKNFHMTSQKNHPLDDYIELRSRLDHLYVHFMQCVMVSNKQMPLIHTLLGSNKDEHCQSTCLGWYLVLGHTEALLLLTAKDWQHQFVRDEPLLVLRVLDKNS